MLIGETKSPSSADEIIAGFEATAKLSEQVAEQLRLLQIRLLGSDQPQPDDIEKLDHVDCFFGDLRRLVSFIQGNLDKIAVHTNNINNGF